MEGGYLLLIGILLSLIDATVADSYCFHISDGYFYCNYGCCGTSYYEYCCGPYDWIYGVAVLGTIVVIAVVVFLVCFFIQKNKKRNGHVIRPQNTTATVTTIHSQPPQYPGGQPQYGQPMPQYGQPMPQYGQPMPQPPAYGQPMGQPQQYPPPPPVQGDAAYPPPPKY